MEDVQRLKSTLQGMVTPVILVSNEVGMGIVPDNTPGTTVSRHRRYDESDPGSCGG